MNIMGVFLHVMADALGSVVVIISSLVIWLTDWEYRLVGWQGMIWKVWLRSLENDKCLLALC